MSTPQVSFACMLKYSVYSLAPLCTCKHLSVYLQQKDGQNHSSNRVHQPHVVVDQRFSATMNEDVELFGLVVVVVVGRVVGDFGLDTGSGRTRVTAAEGHTVNQVTAVHIALDAAGGVRMEKEMKADNLESLKKLS